MFVLVYWPEEESISVVQGNAVSNLAVAIGEECEVMVGKKEEIPMEAGSQR